jgi:hypothetical protein
MSIFNTIPWKAIAGFMPTVMNLVRDAKGDDNTLSELRCKIERLEQLQKMQAGFLKMLLIGFIVSFLMAGAALAIGIVYLSHV